MEFILVFYGFGDFVNVSLFFSSYVMDYVFF